MCVEIQSTSDFGKHSCSILERILTSMMIVCRFSFRKNALASRVCFILLRNALISDIVSYLLEEFEILMLLENLSKYAAPRNTSEWSLDWMYFCLLYTINASVKSIFLTQTHIRDNHTSNNYCVYNYKNHWIDWNRYLEESSIVIKILIN